MDNEQLSEIFKTEYSNLLAVLCNYYRLPDLQLAEDIVSETFVRAMKAWSHKGIPESSKAWLRKVAQNLLYEHHRRNRTYEEKIAPSFTDPVEESFSTEITHEIIEDSQLRMIFVLCDPELNKEAQLCIALRILCGFNIEEIAIALLSNKEAVNKKLFRAKKSLRQRHHLATSLTSEQYLSRLDNVLRVIYLIFSEGYYSSVNEQNIRHEICREALRLALFLAGQKLFPKPQIHALIALMCFHASRINARLAGANGDLLYNEQDFGKWDRQLIGKGKKYLNLSAKGDRVTRYHLEAAIAFWHTTDASDKWNNILQLYDKLLIISYSPVAALNRIYALARANSADEALHAVHMLDLKPDHYYYCLLAELYRMKNNVEKETEYLHEAIRLARKKSEKALIEEKLDKAAR